MNLSINPACTKSVNYRASFGRTTKKSTTVKKAIGNTITGASVALALFTTTLATSNKILQSQKNKEFYQIEQEAMDKSSDDNYFENEFECNYNDSTEIEINDIKQKEDAKNNSAYYVSKGETLWGISNKFGTDVKTFMQKTGLTSESLNCGQIIKDVPTLIIEKNSTISEIAKEKGIDAEQLANLNNLNINSEVTEGEKIYILMDKIAPIKVPEGSVMLADGSIKASEELLRTAKETAPRDAERPAPIIDQNGNITAEIKEYTSTIENGALSGKTVLLNAGHGGYNPNNGLFDPGTHGIDKNGNTVEEWQMNKILAEKVKDNLLKQGADVIYTSGSVYTVKSAIDKLSEKSDAMISLHLNYSENSNIDGYQIYIETADSNKDVELANNLKESIHTESKANVKEDNYAVLRASRNNPSVLIEAGFMSNLNDLKEITSPTIQTERAQEIANGVSNILINK